MDNVFYDQEPVYSFGNITFPARGKVKSLDTLEVNLNAGTLSNIHRYRSIQMFRKIGHRLKPSVFGAKDKS